ncbi:MAG TPA: hypothetical protein ENH41_06090 [Candidatus Omnitrophica bacterium]|nr:hypothetical protein [Candidatus Omnitrophota bacterium]
MKTSTRPIDSVRKRYLVTLFSNSIFFFASLVTAGVVPRALGPKLLGDYSFLSRISSALRNFLNMGTSSAFFNYNSKHENTGPLVRLYSIWFVAQLLITFSLLGLAVFLGLKEFIWPGQELKYIVWVIAFDWVFFSVNILKQLSDSKGYTSRAQLINLALSLVNIILLVSFALSGLLNLGRYIAIQTFTSASISLCIILFIIVPHKDIYWAGSIRGHLREFSKYFYKFCHPLVIVMFVGFIFEYLDRLFLQRFSGSIEQGYFHIASSWAAFATLFTASILSIYKREMASSLGKNDSLRAAEIFSRYLKMMYFLTLVLSVFLAFHANTLLALIAGPKFKAAGVILIIMAFYPIHQVYGQLGGAAFYASERTAILRNISVSAMILGIPLSYFLIAPSTMPIPGLGLGAMGLAIKTVVWNILLVQVYLIWNCRFFKLNPIPFWRHQIYSLLMLVGIMCILKLAISFFLQSLGVEFTVLKLFLDVLVYFAAVAGFVYLRPSIAGIKREEIIAVLKKIKSKLRRDRG